LIRIQGQVLELGYEDDFCRDSTTQMISCNGQGFQST
jgi:hypothetical protein